MTLAAATPRSAADLAPDVGIDRSGVTRRASRLEAAGLVRREADPNDRRATLLVLTERGERAVAELRDDPRLAPYLALATTRFITVPDPKRAVLEATPAQFSAVRIKLTEPPS